MDLSCPLTLNRARELAIATAPNRPSGQRRQRPDSDSYGDTRTHKGPNSRKPVVWGARLEFEPRAAALL